MVHYPNPTSDAIGEGRVDFLSAFGADWFKIELFKKIAFLVEVIVIDLV
jgi:hypothetical protein